MARRAWGLAGVLLALLAGGCSFPAGPDGPAAPAKWTIMVYLDADNNLFANGLQDLNEMEQIELAGEGISVIVLLDTPASPTRLYQVSYDPGGSGLASRELSSAELGLYANGLAARFPAELNMGSPETVRRFIDFGRAAYPAERYALVFWNHGGGWRSLSRTAGGGLRQEPPEVDGGTARPPDAPAAPAAYRAICVDEDNGNDILYTQEIGAALAGKEIDVVCFDLCLGAMIEVAYEIRDYAGYMIASEEVTPADGYEYQEILQNLSALTDPAPLDFCGAVVGAYSAAYAGQPGMTISAIDLSKVGAVKDALDAFSDTLYTACEAPATRTAVREILFNDTEDYYTDMPGDLNLDIWHAADMLSAYVDTQAAVLKAAVEEAVVAKWHRLLPDTNADSHGLAVHYCQLNGFGGFGGYDPAYDRSYTGAYPLAFVKDSTWCPDSSGPGGLLYRLWYEYD